VGNSRKAHYVWLVTSRSVTVRKGKKGGGRDPDSEEKGRWTQGGLIIIMGGGLSLSSQVFHVDPPGQGKGEDHGSALVV